MEQALQPLARRLAAVGVRPNHVTLAGTAFSCVSAGFVATGDLLAGGLIFLLAGTLDTLDGTLARLSGTASARGAFIDSTFDRISEGVVFAALAFYFAARGEAADAALVVVALLGSVLVSYTRARAEVHGIECRQGLGTRGERVLLLGVGLCVGWPALATYLLVAVTAYTAGQRIAVVLRALPMAAPDKDRGEPAASS